MLYDRKKPVDLPWIYVFCAISSKSTGIYKSNSLLFGFTLLGFSPVIFQLCRDKETSVPPWFLVPLQALRIPLLFLVQINWNPIKPPPNGNFSKSWPAVGWFVFIFLFVCLFELGTRAITLHFSDLPSTDQLVFQVNHRSVNKNKNLPTGSICPPSFLFHHFYF